MDYSCSPSSLLKLCHVVHVTTHVIEIAPMIFSVSKFSCKRHSVEMIPRHITKLVGEKHISKNFDKRLNILLTCCCGDDADFKSRNKF